MLSNERQKLVLSLVASAHNLLSPILVTEAGFVEPVRDKVRNHLATTIDLINTKGEKKGKALDAIKKEVKKAANLL